MIIGNKIKSLVGLLHLDRGLDHAQIVSRCGVPVGLIPDKERFFRVTAEGFESKEGST